MDRMIDVKKILIIFFLLILTPAIILILPVKKIECKLSSSLECPETLVTALDSLQNQPLIITDFSNLIANLDLPPGYTLSNVSKSIPDTLKLIFLEEKALFKITCLDCEGELAIGTHRHLLSNSAGDENNTELSTFFISSNSQKIIENNQIKPEYFEPAKNLAESLYKLGFVFQNGEWVSQSEIRINLNNYPVAIFSHDQISKQIAALELILKGDALSQASAEITEIDLRYNMPVLRTRK